jgi:ankyrin repeat protein
MVQACWVDDTKEVLRLLRAGAQINGFSSSGSRPLCRAVEINSHAGYSAESPNGYNPHSADMVKFLMAHGADPNSGNRERYADGRLGAVTIKPLEMALGAAHECSPQPAIIRALLRAGANPNARYSYTSGWVRSESTPLGAAAIWGDTLIMRMLLRAGARVNGRDGHGRTPLMHSAQTVEIWNRRFKTNEAMRLLLRRGARVNARDDKGWTALFHAIANEYHSYEGRYVLEGPANFESVKRLLRHGAHLDARDKRGRTPLMWAAMYRIDTSYADFKFEGLRQDAMVRLLLQSGANASIRDNNGRTARDLARRAGNLHVLRALDKYKPRR